MSVSAGAHALSKKRITLSGRAGPLRPKTTQARSPSKQIQIKPSKIAWISLDLFVRIGTYQRVTRKGLLSIPRLQTSTTGFRFQEGFSRTSNSPQSPKLLVELERCDAFPPTVGELAEILTIERSALGQTLKPVERDGLIALSRDDHDRRRRPARDIRWAGSRCPRSALLAEAHHRFAGFFGEPEMTELRATLRDIAENPQVASAFDQGAASG